MGPGTVDFVEWEMSSFALESTKTFNIGIWSVINLAIGKEGMAWLAGLWEMSSPGGEGGCGGLYILEA